MIPPTREEICVFIENSLSDKQYNDELSFRLSDNCINRINKKLYFIMVGYHCIITSHSIRHIQKKHSEDLKYICEISDILENFSKVEKSLTRCNKTGATLVSLEFYKKFDNDVVKLVKLKVHRTKRLELKTLFVRE